MDLIYKIFNVGLVGADKGKGGLSGNEGVPQ
jgi:hypothetical protein